MTISQKLRITQKKSFVRKNDCQINQDISWKFGHFWTFLLRIFCNFLGDNNSKTKNRKNLKHDFSFVSAHCAFFMWRMFTSEGRGEVCISLVGKQPNYKYIYIYTHIFIWSIYVLLIMIRYNYDVIMWVYPVFKLIIIRIILIIILLE